MNSPQGFIIVLNLTTSSKGTQVSRLLFIAPWIICSHGAIINERGINFLCVNVNDNLFLTSIFLLGYLPRVHGSKLWQSPTFRFPPPPCSIGIPVSPVVLSSLWSDHLSDSRHPVKGPYAFSKSSACTSLELTRLRLGVSPSLGYATSTKTRFPVSELQQSGWISKSAKSVHVNRPITSFRGCRMHGR